MKILLWYGITNHMRMVSHLYHPVVWYKCKSKLYLTITEFLFVAVLERLLTYDCKTKCSFVYLIFAVLLYINLTNDSRLLLDLCPSINVCMWLVVWYINERYIPEHQNKLNIYDLQNYEFFANFFSNEKNS